MSSPETTTPVQLPVRNFAPNYRRVNCTPLAFSAHLQDVYISNDFNLHINDTRAMPALPTTPQHTKFYIPLLVENYGFLTAGQDDDNTNHCNFRTSYTLFATALTTWQTTSAGIRPTTTTTFGS